MVKDEVETPSGERVYHLIETLDGVLVVPVKITGDNELSFVLVEQYRYPIGRKQLEFPGGAKDPQETNEQTARRELKEETGYDAEELKFMYTMNAVPSMSSFTTAVYLAVVGQQSDLTIEEDEEAAELKVVEHTADEMLTLIQQNEITDGKTLAALSAILLQSPQAVEYMKALS